MKIEWGLTRPSAVCTLAEDRAWCCMHGVSDGLMKRRSCYCCCCALLHVKPINRRPIHHGKRHTAICPETDLYAMDFSTNLFLHCLTIGILYIPPGLQQRPWLSWHRTSSDQSAQPDLTRLDRWSSAGRDVLITLPTRRNWFVSSELFELYRVLECS